MHDTKQWDVWAKGDGCPFCAPRADHNEFHDLVAKLGISSLYLSKNQTYFGTCVLIFDKRHAIRPDQLTPDEWRMFTDDLFRAQNAVMRAVKPDHMNLASLGNVIPHLHWHITPRFKADPRWGAPIWPTNLADMPHTALPDAEHRRLLDTLKAEITASN